MIKATKTCDITGRHGGKISTLMLPVLFDFDQEDGKSKVQPYFEQHKLEICDYHFQSMVTKRKLIHGYGAMGHNTYSL